MIRNATPADFPAIAALQIASWRSAYAGQLPEEYFGQPIEDDLNGNWSRHKINPRDVVLVNDENGRLTGFINVLAQQPPYVDNLHVDPDEKGKGIGTTLMAAAANRLIAQGDTAMCLTVLSTNEPGLKFYERIGGERGPLKHEHMYDLPVTSYPMIWHDLPALAELGVKS